MLLKVKNITSMEEWKGWYKIEPINFDKTVSFLHDVLFLNDFMVIGNNIYTKNLAYLKEVS